MTAPGQGPPPRSRIGLWVAITIGAVLLIAAATFALVRNQSSSTSAAGTSAQSGGSATSDPAVGSVSTERPARSASSSTTQAAPVTTAPAPVTSPPTPRPCTAAAMAEDLGITLPEMRKTGTPTCVEGWSFVCIHAPNATDVCGSPSDVLHLVDNRWTSVSNFVSPCVDGLVFLGASRSAATTLCGPE